ncbi:hypothetical protein CHI09_13550 [Shouchella clausii]|jgi:hypothetical protein|nr:hypothetical protein CHI09_13550 [Shouchella clausii]
MFKQSPDVYKKVKSYNPMNMLYLKGLDAEFLISQYRKTHFMKMTLAFDEQKKREEFLKLLNSGPSE